MKAPGQLEEMRRRPGLGEEQDGRGWRVPRLQFLDEVPEMASPRIKILECDASRAVGWKRSDWAKVVEVLEHEHDIDQMRDGSP